MFENLCVIYPFGSDWRSQRRVDPGEWEKSRKGEEAAGVGWGDEGPGEYLGKEGEGRGLDSCS